MINRIKFLTVLILGSLGLSGCLLVEDDVPVYSSYPYGSYEAAVDYYHRPPRETYYISHHKHAVPVYPDKHHPDKHHHLKKPEPPKGKIHNPKAPEHHDFKRDIKKPEHHDFKKDIKKLEHHDFKKDMKKPEHHDFKKDIKKPEHHDFKNDMKKPEHHDFKNDIKKPEPKKPDLPVKEKISQPKVPTPAQHDLKKANMKNPNLKLHGGKHR